MNSYKEAWMAHANMLPIYQRQHHVALEKKGLPSELKLASAVGKTARAAAIAVAISQIDGPLPVADVLAAAYFTASAVDAWHDYFS